MRVEKVSVHLCNMSVLSRILCHKALSSSCSLLAEAPVASGLANATRAYASGSGYTIIDHEYDAVVVGAGGACLSAQDADHVVTTCNLPQLVDSTRFSPCLQVLA